jgi:Arc/MetJ-type ribon-helix-helix transcriptional regulator
MAQQTQTKRDFATRLSPQTLTQLDELVQRGRFKTRTEAIEAAVKHLYDAEQQEQEELQEAFDSACGALSLGVDREAWEQAELERLESEVARNTGRWRKP